MKKTFLVAGGDLRFVTLADRLAECYTVYAVGFGKNVDISDRVRVIDWVTDMDLRADYIILPLPVSADGITVSTPYSGSSISLESLIPVIKDDGIVLGGMLAPDVRKLFEEKGITVEDYASREEFAVLNAVATAEGAIQVAMEELATTLSGRKVLVLGAGRIAKVLIDMLKGFHADITVAARKCSDLAWARVYGCGAVNISSMNQQLEESEVIINTIPAVILDEKKLKLISKNSLVIDLASKPGGVDFDTAGKLGIKAVWLLSLPGKVAPVTSGEVIAETVINILSERGELDDRL
ncbi:MAG: dipicolinate synthase subunit DpsA [Oscillospiraceae bacterium]|nr:dipicolinate synthase subunit DpsA [Oscillospiraceae bacterium]